MSSHQREHKDCQNCGYTVDRYYCSNCGQKNVYTRQPFIHLFAHFIEDLTHYDGAFWNTIKHLLFRPARLTREYLDGKRQSYVPPVKLYIFISFVTFFLLSTLPDNDDEAETSGYTTSQTIHKDGEAASKFVNDTIVYKTENKVFHSVKEVEEYQEKASDDAKLFFINYWIAKAVLNVEKQEVSSHEMANAILHTLPKVLFLYMPIFSFWLWLLHGKKRWYFFDHAIFTLHYFSLLLLLIIIYALVLLLLSLIVNEDITFWVSVLLALFLYIYVFFYFFRSHRRMYGEKRWVSRTKSFILFWINFICIFIALLAGFIYAMLSIH